MLKVVWGNPKQMFVFVWPKFISYCLQGDYSYKDIYLILQCVHVSCITSVYYEWLVVFNKQQFINWCNLELAIFRDLSKLAAHIGITTIAFYSYTVLYG